MKNIRKYLITLMCLVLSLQSFSLIAIAQTTSSTDSIKTTITVPSGSITNRGEVTIQIDLSGSAGSFTPTNGDLTVTVPKDIVYNVTDFTSKLDLPVPFKLKTITSDATNYKILISVDTTLIASNEAFHGIFQIKFGAPILTIGDAHNDTQTFSVDYATKHDDITVAVSKKNPIVKPIFDKWYKGDLDSNNVAVLNTTAPEQNKFQLVVNYKRIALNDVVITDKLPDGTSLVATNKNSVIPGSGLTIDNIRILKASSFDEDGVVTGYKYVTDEFQGKISYDTVTRTFTVNLGNMTVDDTYFIEYALKVDDPNIGQQVNTANFTASNAVSIQKTLPVKPIQHFGTSYLLSKSVDKQVLNYDENTLIYTLKLMSLDGANIPAGTIVTDPLDPRIHITSILDYDKSKFDIQYDADSVTIKTLVDTPKNETNSWAFEANVSTLKVGDSLLNSAYLDVSNNIIQSNTVATKKYDGRIQIVKKDNFGKPVAGAEYTITDTNGATMFQGKTDKDGILLSAALQTGTYTIVETDAPAGYVLDSTPQVATITEQDTDPIILQTKNNIKTGSVELTKVDAADHTTVLANAVFNLLDENGALLKQGLTTGADGILTVANLNPGKYSFVETSAPTGYVLDSTPIPFEITFGDDQTPVALVKENTMKNGSVQLTKVDSDDHTILLEGATFNLLNENGTILKQNLTTDDAGILTVANLKPGKYSFVETSAPAGYILDNTPTEFEIPFGDDQTPVALVKENTMKTRSAQLTKVDSADHTILLAGATFDLLDEQGTVLQTDLTTDKNGFLEVTSLKPGKYSFVETAAPVGYTLDNTPTEFEIPFGDDQSPVVLVKENTMKHGSVELTKVNAEDHTILLSGAVFDLLDEQGNILKEGLTTDENGFLTVADLKPGRYSFVEIHAPAGYTLDGTPLSFEIPFGDDQMPIQVVMENSVTFQPTPPIVHDPPFEEQPTPEPPAIYHPTPVSPAIPTKEAPVIKEPVKRAPTLEEPSAPTKETLVKLPKTGDSSERNLILFGLLLCTFASLVFIVQIRTKRN